MRIVDEVCIKRIREQAGGRCEACLMRADLHVHHLFSRGAGRLDIPVNLIAVCPACHAMIHNAWGERLKKIKRLLLTLVALREQTSPERIEATIYRLRRLYKHAEIVNELPEQREATNG